MLCEKLRINETNLSLRLSFMNLGQAELNTIRRLQPWLKKRASRIARKFYDFQFEHESSLGFFNEYAERNNIPLARLREHLESAQTEYMLQWGLAGERGIDLKYFERRLRIGQLHNQIGLPQKWYMGSYALYMQLLEDQLRRDYFFRPFFRNRARRALFRIMLLDMQAVSDGFLVDLLGELGDVERIITVRNNKEDLSDHVNGVKMYLRELLEKVTSCCEELSGAMDSLRAKAETLSSSAQQEAASIQQMNATLMHIRQSVTQNDERVRETACITIGRKDSNGDTVELTTEETLSLTAAMRDIGSASREIAEIVDLINEIAFQTNLLALNASVEAARAGHNGRGFAVVANEVRALSVKTKESSENIKRLVQRATGAITKGDSFVLDVAERIQAIAEDLGRQTTSIAEFTSASQEIDRAAQSNAQGADEIFSIAEQLRENTRELRQALKGQSVEDTHNSPATAASPY
ncbi:globin-coupled sensor protein [Natronospira bacteriovora]|uniref:Globin-coupled sensor protein n=1 Tax=Natronospira bacteriovora TaxID=3069753 RepID=A0ABU0W7R4_9GAMM|nr:globin-coupled sensor protein [Natronospira sp. AB-CW4]MDQ2070077.1 globin-coupled sensor protein [Natronospira sp. AB-CW4]